MIRHIFLLALLSGCVFSRVSGQENLAVKKDLQDQWMVFDDNSFSMAENKATRELKSIHFLVEANKFPQDRLQIKSARPYFLFMNGKLIKEHTGTLDLRIDSLSNAGYTNTLNFSVYQKSINDKDLKTLIVSSNTAAQQFQNSTKPPSYFKDFVIIAGLMLIIFFVVMIRIHPKLAADYFSVTRILSMRETEDNQSHARFAISSNVLFYVFGSLLTGLCLIILFYHLPDNYLLPLEFKAFSFGGVLWQWIKLSVVILMILFCKILLIFSLSSLFGMRGIAGIHFFNWVRLLLIVSGLLSGLLFIYFISRGMNEEIYVGVLTAIILALVGWIAIVFLKLNNRIEHSMFHLFSYICATEVIPLLITIKVLFN